MRPAIWIPVLLIAALAAAAAGVLLLPDSRRNSPLDAIPDDMPLALEASDLARLARALDRTRLTLAGADPGRGADIFLEGIAEIFHIAGAGYVSPAPLLEQATGAVAIGVVPGAPSGRTELLMAIRTADGADQDPAGMRRAMASGGVWSDRRHRAHVYAVLRVEGEAAPVCVTRARGLLLVSTSGQLMRRALDALDGRSRSLRRDPAARVALQRLPRRADLYLHLSGNAVRAWVEQQSASVPRLARAAELSGLRALRRAVLSVQVRQGLFREGLFLVLAPRERGLAGALLDGPPRAEARHVPDEGRFAARAAVSLGDPLRAWGSLTGLLLPPDGAGDAAADRLRGAEEFLDIDLERELFESLGRDVRLAWGSPDPLPRSAAAGLGSPWRISIALRNPDGVRRVLRRTDGLARALGSLHTSGPAGSEIVWYEFPSIAPLTPAYRLRGRMLHIASSPEALSGDAPERIEEAGDPPPAMDRLLPPQAHVYFQISTRRLADAVRPGVLPGGFRARLREAIVGMVGMEAPASAGAARMDGSGLLLMWVSPLSAPALMLGAADRTDNGESHASEPAAADADQLY